MLRRPQQLWGAGQSPAKPCFKQRQGHDDAPFLRQALSLATNSFCFFYGVKGLKSLVGRGAKPSKTFFAFAFVIEKGSCGGVVPPKISAP